MHQFIINSKQNQSSRKICISNRFYNKVEDKFINSCILDEKKTVQRPDLIIGEESIYTKKFYAAVQEQKAFHKKNGNIFFFLFERKAKIFKDIFSIL